MHIEWKFSGLRENNWNRKQVNSLSFFILFIVYIFYSIFFHLFHSRSLFLMRIITESSRAVISFHFNFSDACLFSSIHNSRIQRGKFCVEIHLPSKNLRLLHLNDLNYNGSERWEEWRQKTMMELMKCYWQNFERQYSSPISAVKFIID